MNRILIVAGHPDDEIIGCGGTAARLAQEKHHVTVAILGEGLTSRSREHEPDKKQKELNLLKQQARLANRVIGIEDLFFFDLPDNRFDTIPFLDIVKLIEQLKEDVRPDIIFTHSKYDLNIDHRMTFQAVLTATRPIPGEPVKEIHSFEVLSSTEWNFPSNFRPNLFFDIKQTIDLKKQALEHYAEEIKSYPHPRSTEGIELNARHWGMQTGIEFAEAFQTVRVLK